MGLLSLILPLLGNGGGPGRRDLSFPSAVSGSGFFIRLSGIPQCLTKLSRARPPSHSLCRNRTGCSRFCQILHKSKKMPATARTGLGSEPGAKNALQVSYLGGRKPAT